MGDIVLIFGAQSVVGGAGRVGVGWGWDKQRADDPSLRNDS